MTPEILKALILAGETMPVEFKGESGGPLNDRDLVEAVVCLANRIGSEPAHLLVGVEDDGRITGARPRHGKTTNARKLESLIAARTRPALSVSVEIVVIDGKTLLVIRIPLQRQPVGTSDGVFLRRAMGGDGRPACQPMDAHEIQSLLAGRGLHDPTEQVVAAARWEDLDPLEFERFRRSIHERRGRSDESLLDLTDLDLAKSLGVVDANGSVRGIRLAGLLLFGREEALRRLVPAHETAFQLLRDLDIAVNDFFRWPLLRVMEEIETRIRVRNSERELMMGLLRVGVPDYSERALREALANALIHRDYHRLGAIHFQWHSNRIEISSPGGFPEGVRLDNLLVTAPRPRNPLLADAFKRAGIVERTARGIDTIFYEQLRNGRPAPFYDRSDHVGVTVVLPGGEANLEFVRLIVAEADKRDTLKLDDLLILNALWRERSLTTDAASRLIQKPEADSRSVLHHLVEAGFVEERGKKSGRTWHLSAATYRALGAKATYVLQRGFEPIQQEQMVLQFVETHGRITRQETATLCKITDPQAYRLLKTLTGKGLLAREGKVGRGVGYLKAGT